MSTGLILLHISLAVVAFLVVLNGYLRGSKREEIDTVLSLAWIALLIAAFVLFGWKAGLLAIPLSFVYSWSGRPLAAMMARRLLGYRTSMEFSDMPRGSTAELLQGNISGEEWIKRASDEREDQEERFSEIAQRKHIASLLRERQMTVDDLRESYWFLMRIGLGDQAWDIISKRSHLELLLELQEQGLAPLEIATRLMRR
jgi:hypothetical protein